MWSLSDSGFSSISGLAPVVDLVVLLYEEHNEKIENIHEIREGIENFVKEHIDQWRSDYSLLDQIIKFVEMGLANYEVVRSLTQVSLIFINPLPSTIINYFRFLNSLKNSWRPLWQLI